jgi:hypothetical protein
VARPPAASEAFGKVDNLAILNGAQGVGEIMNQVIGQAGPALRLARETLGRQGAEPAANGRPGAGSSGRLSGYVPVCRHKLKVLRRWSMGY